MFSPLSALILIPPSGLVLPCYNRPLPAPHCRPGALQPVQHPDRGIPHAGGQRETRTDMGTNDARSDAKGRGGDQARPYMHVGWDKKPCIKQWASGLGGGG